MNFIFIFLLVSTITLSIKHLALKRQIQNVSRQIDKVTSGETEKMLDISFIDSDLELLAGKINSFFTMQRASTAKALLHEEQLKESIADISHDLRTPLTVIIGHLQMLQKTQLLPDQQQRVETALRKAYRLKDLIITFYDLSLLETDKVNPHWETINFSNLLIDFLAENAPLFQSRQICPNIMLPNSSVFVYADRNMLDRILQNLLINAVRYTAGSISLSLSLSPDQHVVLEISNTVDNPENLDVSRLFERFYTEDPSRHNESTGLGLSVVKLLTEKLNGSVHASIHENTLCLTVTLKTSPMNQ